MGSFISSLIASLQSKNLEFVIVGLDNSGKTTLLNQLAGQVKGGAHDTIPTIGSDLQTFKAKGINMKVWDLGGQTRFRAGWQRYAMGCDVILFVVDACDVDRMQEARRELHTLLEEEELRKLPLLVVANKIDREPHVSRDELIKTMNLDYITDVPWTVACISAKFSTNLVDILQWLVRQTKRRR
nr:Arl18 [Gefionella okellyi]|eukprot:TRINITY_DN14128_c0_g1_i1.p1 TRINITY_DN14128_c0_g1~~TRINITY_DN14128_c0_g1_i1.p1  ORF type:complete len:184 (-),score=28.43 TRINITY_DN14128_c0_g1_i1:81-632(-)